MAAAHSESIRIGEVIRRARVLQGRSQKDVAASLGYHQSKVSRLESGRGTDNMGVLRAVAAELRIPAWEVGLAVAREASTADPGAEDMQRRTFIAASMAVSTAALTASPDPLVSDSPACDSSDARIGLVRALLPGTSPEGTGASLDTNCLRLRVGAARRLFHLCDYAGLEQVLPGLIADLRQASGGTAGSTDLSGLLATAYQTLTSLLLKQNDQGNAWLAVGRAMTEAERCGDPVVLASSVRVQAHVLARAKHPTQAVSLVRHTAERLTGSYDRRSPQYLAALGLLLLRGVTSAGSGGDRGAARELLTEAKEVARYVALDRPDAWASFSPTNVALHEVSALVAFGDADRALRTARPLMRRPLPVPERRASLWIDTARAYSQQGRLADGYQALRIAETCAAQDVRRPAVRELVAGMAARDRRRTLPELHRFSRRLGVTA
ncbi:helix-turn-helix transcriptional regulator [Streptomyces sp. NPDC052020]|uniref:helix-turn-helix domain-containing protein n=1 Tax=Streptomyces sp. NPDC052020 TaxID=3155677 RepID=UPI00341509F0